ncbi:hypothetical protein GCM10010240_55270 [Streptomyces griseoviridis]|nr:hypothetical protein GCM10010240_55270 [Streptomyces griseoviridis]
MRVRADRDLTPRNRDDGGTAGKRRPWRPARTRSAPPAAGPRRLPEAETAVLPLASAAPAGPCGVRRVGNAWLVHPAAGPDRQSLLFAAGLAADPEYTLVVVDLPPYAPLDGVEEALARDVPAGPAGLRVVFGRTPAQGAAPTGRRLARRLGQPVVVPDGIVRPSAGGALFIGADRGRGWVRCAPGGESRFLSRRFPRPAWDGWLPDRPGPVGPSAVAEPLGAGVWVRPVREDADQQRHRGRLAARLRRRDDAPTVVLGSPGAPEPPAEDVAHFWRSLPGHPPAAPRFVLYGTVPAPGSRPFGETLAALTGEPVHVCNGFPTGDPRIGRDGGEEVLLLTRDGTPARPVFAREFLHLPPEPGSVSHAPLATDHRWPLGHLPMLRQGLYRGGPGVVLEVLPWGLWVRPAVEPAHADEVRAAPADPQHALILCDDSAVEDLPRLRGLAQDVLHRLPAEDGLLVRVVTADRPWGTPGGRPRALPAGPAAAPSRALPAAPPAPPAERPAPPPPADPVPAAPPPPAAPVPAAPPRGAGTGTPKDTAVVALALQHEPGLGGLLPPDIVLAGLLAVRLRLTVSALRAGREPEPYGSGEPPDIDPETLAALALLPVHQGVVALRAELDAAELRRYRTGRTATAHRVCAGSLSGVPGVPGNTDVLVHSLTGRRTALLEPELPDRVLFTPGTRFEVLGVAGPAGGRAAVLLAEAPPPGLCTAGATRREVARRLAVMARLWRADERNGVVRPRDPDPFALPPRPDRPASPVPGPGRSAEPRPVALSGRYR